MGKFLIETKRRHVYRVAAAYAVAAWVFIQIVNNPAPTFDLPPWIAGTVVLLLIVGLPITLLIARMRELAPADGMAATAVTSNSDWALMGALIVQILRAERRRMSRVKTFLKGQCLAVGIAYATLIMSTAMAADETSELPDLSGQWGRNTIFFERPPSGPGPVVTRFHNPDGTIKPEPWAGDYTNPILKPDAAEAVRKRGETAMSGTVAADLHNSCWPEPPPYSMSLDFGVNILQQKDEVTLIYLLYNTVRHVHLNARHPENPTPSWQGDSIGRYEGDSLVVDTVGIKAAPISTVDAFGTPHSEALHVVERYRLIDGSAAVEAQRKQGILPVPEGALYGRGRLDPDTNKKGLQVEFTVEDEHVFTTAWSGRVTYQRVIGDCPGSALCGASPIFRNRGTHSHGSQTGFLG